MRDSKKVQINKRELGAISLHTNTAEQWTSCLIARKR